MKNLTIYTLMYLIICAFSLNTQAQVIETWNNKNIGSKTITKAGTYQVKGTVQGMVNIAPGLGRVTIVGVGTNPTFKDIKTNTGQSGIAVFTAKKTGSKAATPVTLKNLTVRYGNKGGDIHKGTWLKGQGSKIIDCKFYSEGPRNKTAGQVAVGQSGIINRSYCKIIDDGFKLTDPGTVVRNSTVDMIGNGSGITLDYGQTSNGAKHHAINCTIKGYSGHHTPAGNTSTKAQDCALNATTVNKVTDVKFDKITIINGKNFGHIIKICTYKKAGLPNPVIDGVVVKGSITGGVQTVTKNGTTWSPVCINAHAGEIKNVTINFGGALKNKSHHFLNGKLTNVVIDGIRYNGTFNNKFGNQVKSTEDEFSTQKVTSFVTYPNPADDIINIVTQNLEGARLNLINFSGQTLYSTHIQSTLMQLNVSEFESGIYFIHVQSDTVNTIEEIIIK